MSIQSAKAGRNKEEEEEVDNYPYANLTTEDQISSLDDTGFNKWISHHLRKERLREEDVHTIVEVFKKEKLQGKDFLDPDVEELYSREFVTGHRLALKRIRNHLTKRTEVAAPLTFDVPQGWQRNLTAEGIEPNPGPTWSGIKIKFVDATGTAFELYLSAFELWLQKDKGYEKKKARDRISEEVLCQLLDEWDPPTRIDEEEEEEEDKKFLAQFKLEIEKAAGCTVVQGALTQGHGTAVAAPSTIPQVQRQPVNNQVQETGAIEASLNILSQYDLPKLLPKLSEHPKSDLPFINREQEVFQMVLAYLHNMMITPPLLFKEASVNNIAYYSPFSGQHVGSGKTYMGIHFINSVRLYLHPTKEKEKHILKLLSVTEFKQTAIISEEYKTKTAVATFNSPGSESSEFMDYTDNNNNNNNNTDNKELSLGIPEKIISILRTKLHTTFLYVEDAEHRFTNALTMLLDMKYLYIDMRHHRKYFSAEHFQNYNDRINTYCRILVFILSSLLAHLPDDTVDQSALESLRKEAYNINSGSGSSLVERLVKISLIKPVLFHFDEIDAIFSPELTELTVEQKRTRLGAFWTAVSVLHSCGHQFYLSGRSLLMYDIGNAVHFSPHNGFSPMYEIALHLILNPFRPYHIRYLFENRFNEKLSEDYSQHIIVRTGGIPRLVSWAFAFIEEERLKHGGQLNLSLQDGWVRSITETAGTKRSELSAFEELDDNLKKYYLLLAQFSFLRVPVPITHEFSFHELDPSIQCKIPVYELVSKLMLYIEKMEDGYVTIVFPEVLLDLLHRQLEKNSEYTFFDHSLRILRQCMCSHSAGSRFWSKSKLMEELPLEAIRFLFLIGSRVYKSLGEARSIFSATNISDMKLLEELKDYNFPKIERSERTTRWNRGAKEKVLEYLNQKYDPFHWVVMHAADIPELVKHLSVGVYHPGDCSSSQDKIILSESIYSERATLCASESATWSLSQTLSSATSSVSASFDEGVSISEMSSPSLSSTISNSLSPSETQISSSSSISAPELRGLYLQTKSGQPITLNSIAEEYRKVVQVASKSTLVVMGFNFPHPNNIGVPKSEKGVQQKESELPLPRVIGENLAVYYPKGYKFPAINVKTDSQIVETIVEVSDDLDIVVLLKAGFIQLLTRDCAAFIELLSAQQGTLLLANSGNWMFDKDGYVDGALTAEHAKSKRPRSEQRKETTKDKDKRQKTIHTSRNKVPNEDL